MSAPQAYTDATLLRMLRAYATLEADGQTMSAIALAEQIGMAGGTGPGLRRACVECGWLDVVEPPRGSLPGRLRVTSAGWAALDTGVAAAPVKAVPYSRAKALRALRLVADAEAAGSTISGPDLGVALDCSEQHGAAIRADLLSRGWVRAAGWLGRTSVLRLTVLGWDALVDAPPPQKGGQSALRQRRCLCCGSDFASEGVGNRICTPCKGTTAFQSSEVTLHAVARSRR
ncbi:hypothetical protein [Azospirillum agricola]|uniref:hypothetical protein n=1 Tax=Azospirillum agricola TaxID=1720247 RepID=UPI000A0F3B73|nr:hypothetical protein [Azospirillum agricola]SMH62870.1 hypothetical protein SAMN02982994_6693 [Azospirillum lipoferum]